MTQDFFRIMLLSGASCSTSSSATSLRGGNGMGMTMSPSRPHKRRSSGAKVMDGDVCD